EAAPALADPGRGACIAVMSDHVADVYGLSASPSRPFLYCSVSRDTTLRVFSLEGVASSIKARAVVGNSLLSALSNTADAMLPASPTGLCGTASKRLEIQLRGLWRDEGASSIAAFRNLFEFFWASDGIDTFWEMIRWVIHAAAVTKTTVTTTTTTTNCASLSIDSKSALWIERSGARTTGESARGDRRLGRFDRLERASRLYLAAGDLRGSCEAHISLGRWQTALSLAPGVGMEYWRVVSDRYVDVLLE
ncbi:unnamed protein product, partial [Hapterophycus canaliculatus]